MGKAIYLNIQLYFITTLLKIFKKSKTLKKMHTVNTIKRMNIFVKTRLEKNLNTINEFYKGSNSI
jgi:hypothetical protein